MLNKKGRQQKGKEDGTEILAPSTTSRVEYDEAEKFNELDNWLGIMDIDPPITSVEKEAMYERLLDILDDMFAGIEKQPQTLNPGTISDNTNFTQPSKKQLFAEMQKIIGR